MGLEWNWLHCAYEKWWDLVLIYKSGVNQLSYYIFKFGFQMLRKRLSYAT